MVVGLEEVEVERPLFRFGLEELELLGFVESGFVYLVLREVALSQLLEYRLLMIVRG